MTRTVGWFTTVRPVRLTTPTAVDTVGGLLRSIKETMRSAPGHGYGLLRWTDPVGRDRLAEAGNAPLGFNYLGVVDKTEQARPFRPLPGGEVLGGGGGPAMRLMHAVEIVAWLEKTTVGARLRARLVYPAAVCDQRDMEALGAAWGEALRLLASLAEDPDGGGMTPSDVVLVDVTQEDLDAFENGLDDEWGNL